MSNRIQISMEFPKTLGRKLMIGAGAALIVGMLLVAAFALGVYVGEHGWTQDGLALRGPNAGQAAPQPDQPFGGPGGLGGQQPLPGGGRAPDLTGRVRSIFEGTLILATVNGARTVELSEETRLETHTGEARPLDDLAQGQLVAVYGQRSNGGQVLLAELIVLLPQAEQQPPRGQP